MLLSLSVHLAVHPTICLPVQRFVLKPITDAMSCQMCLTQGFAFENDCPHVGVKTSNK